MHAGYDHSAHADEPSSDVSDGCVIFSSSFGGQVMKRTAYRLVFAGTEEQCTGKDSGSHPVSFEVGERIFNAHFFLNVNYRLHLSVHVIKKLY